MRLLDVRALQLKEFVDNTPPYAILSHTWEEEEVLFADLFDLESAKKKKGFEKVSKACEQARRDGFDWIWIDTLCIDKSSSAELSEAINSMFAWYKRAAQCYAYLFDVSGLHDFKGSKWFTRAWTLQELLAPSSIGQGEIAGMEFFSSKWKSLGTKATLSRRISAVTGIAEAYLRGQSLDTASISMRMSWAAERRATRAEDIAYSLLGIFDVNMPLLYGEGKVKAFRRLQEEIMKISEDETLFAWESMEIAADDTSGDALASDPKDFLEARNLVPFASDDPVAPYALTHRGLRIWLQVYEYNEEIRPLRSPIMIRTPLKLEAAVLRCHVAHDFKHVVVIPLRHLTANLYIRDTTTNVGLLPTRSLSVYSPSLQMREIYIRNSRIPSISNSVHRRWGFLLRSIPPGLKVTNAFPKEWWNAADRILQGDRDARGLRSWHASLELSSHDSSPALPSRYSIFLSLGLRQESDYHEPKPWCHLDDHVWHAYGTFEAYHKSASSKPWRNAVEEFHGFEGAIYHESLNVAVFKERVFGQRMFVVEIEYSEKGGNLGVPTRGKGGEENSNGALP